MIRKKGFKVFSIVLLSIVLLATSFLMIGCETEDDIESEIKTYCVTLELSDGNFLNESILNTIEVESGSKIFLQDDPIKEGFEFKGWFKDEKLVFKWDIENDTVTCDLTLYAKWEEKNYDVTFDNGENLTIFSFNANTLIDNVPYIERENYYFIGWFKDSELTLAWNFEADRVNDNITLYAKWEIISYNVTFEPNNGEEASIYKFANNALITNGPSFAKAGYVLVGWYIDEELLVLWNYSSDRVSGNMTLYAKWEPIVYNVTYNLNGGVNSIYNPTNYVEGSRLTFDSPKRSGYEFIGWYTNSNLTGLRVVEIENAQADGISLYAKWAVERFEMPILMIDIENGKPLSEINREDYVNTNISLLNTQTEYILDEEKAEFKGRGNGSWGQEKKGYRIKFNEKLSLFGNEKSKHWVLVPGPESDNTREYIRNGLAYTIVNQILDGIEYTTSVNYVDLYVNGEYRGVYSFFEHIRVDKGRVDIESEYGVEDTGYLIEYDAYATGVEGIDWFKIDGLKYNFTVKSPDPEEYFEEGIDEATYRAQILYIQGYMKQVVDAVIIQDYATFSTLADVNSFVDMYILHELFKNTDSGFSSFYFYKKPSGKIFCGPAWDFDISAGVSRGDASPIGIYVADSIQIHSNFTSSEIFIALMQNENFVNAVKYRWTSITKLVERTIKTFISSVHVYEDSFQRDINVFFGQDAYQWTDVVAEIQDWLITRIEWLNEEWFDETAVSIEPEVDEIAGTVMIWQAYGTGNKTDGAVSHSFIELYNNSDEDIDLTGYSIQYSDTGTDWELINLSGYEIKAYSSFLILGNLNNASANLMLNEADADIVTSFELSNDRIKICLIKSETELTVKNPFSIDGFGTKANGYVDLLAAVNSSTIDAGEMNAPDIISKQKSARRNSLTDSDNNSNDFVTVDYRADKITVGDMENLSPKGTSYGAWNPITFEMNE